MEKKGGKKVPEEDKKVDEQPSGAPMTVEGRLKAIEE